jgi:Domain of unknown function (DUF4304)
MTPKYLFDTNVFNRIFELEIEEEWFPRDAQYFMTHIQRDELAKTPDPLRRLHLMFVLSSIGPTSISTASAMWNVCERPLTEIRVVRFICPHISLHDAHDHQINHSRGHPHDFCRSVCRLTYASRFSAKGTNYWRSTEGFFQSVNFQASPWGTQDAGSFTINLGVTSPVLYEAFTGRDLSHVARLGPIRPSDLASRMQMDASMLTCNMQALVARAG